MKILASACLMGENCKYNGGNNLSEKLLEFIERNNAQVVTVCPEVLGGLPVPRVPSEIVNGNVTNREGVSVDREFRAGAAEALEIAREEMPDLIVLQSRSPSCGVKEVYDGSFSGRKVPGKGVYAAMAAEAGFSVVDIEDL
ncbi:MAG: DUF523 domain-containing protein [Lachnospiraceae bacterium]|nr:DUF523 domain-containing protein [Lachnospiraceae bacterium]